VLVEDGQVLAIEGDPANPVTSGGPCLKGLAYVERVASPDRLRKPLIRHADGTLHEASWDEALDRIAGPLERLRSELGPKSVAFVAGSGTKGLLNGVADEFWRLFGGCTTTYGDLCWPAGLEATRLTLGDNRHSTPEDLANARLIVLWGKNPAETNIHQMSFIRQAQDAGARVVVIDPRRTDSAEGADLLIQPRPGTDGALALAVARVLVEQDWIDREFISRHVRGFHELSSVLPEYPVDRASELSGVPHAAIEELARLLGTVRPATICAGFGMQRYTSSGQTMRALIALVAITGNVGRPGAGWVYANLQSHVFSDLRDPVAFYPPKPETADGSVRVSLPIARLGEALVGQRDPPVRALWIERGNPVTQCPGTSSTLAALRQMELVVVVDQFVTDTAREAHVVLPAKSFLEQTDVITAYWHHLIQLRPQVVAPPPGVLPESEIYWRLAERLGVGLAERRRALPEPGEAGVMEWLERRLEPWPELSLESLRRGPVTAPGAEPVAWADLEFPTPSGRIELVSERAAELWGVDPLPRWSEPVEPVHLGGRDGQLALLTPNSQYRIHSQFGNLEVIRGLDPEPVVALHPDDAAARSIETGMLVRVDNRNGWIELPARVDAGLRPGCVAVVNGWWLADGRGGGVNQLSRPRETDLGHGAAFHDTVVRVERVE
jgi:anaerobic selenocysteine-containing dehydrogenase